MGTLIGLGFGFGLVLVFRTLMASSKIKPAMAGQKTPDWPSFVDDVASGVRAGMSVAEALFEAGNRLPLQLSTHFNQARSSWQGQVGFLEALGDLEKQIQDPIFSSFQRTVELGYLQGGSNLPTVLNQLARSLRVSRQLVYEIRGRQAVTINSAKVAVGAPFLVLLVTGTRPEVRSAYTTATGFLVLVTVVLVAAAAYFTMQYLARMPEIEEIR